MDTFVVIALNEKKRIYNELLNIARECPNNQQLGNVLRSHIINTVADLNADTDNPDQGKLNL